MLALETWQKKFYNMALFNYRKYKVSLRHDSKKTQGLKTGDIVRRQYFDGRNLVYSLMCVLSYGSETVVDEDTGEYVNRSYFIGALLEGDVPSSDEILDFARITNLFDTERSGALYLTASDVASPYMDVIDGIGMNKSLCWPEGLGTEYEDARSQYVVLNKENIASKYIDFEQDNNRILSLTVGIAEQGVPMGISQDFYEYVENPNRVVVSYKIKANSEQMWKASLGYTNGVRMDAEFDVPVTTEWQYKLHVITVDWSGRHLRTFKLQRDSDYYDSVEIADFNIILLSSLTNFEDASQIRVGKLSGLVDPVFGQLDSYGGYFQKLFASGSAHVSGTLTAGDENGFTSTFYAGKIHRNAFLNSLDINFTTGIDVDSDMSVPCGVGKVYSFSDQVEMQAQEAAWFEEHIGKTYCLSFWLYAKQACQISVLQNNHVVGTVRFSNFQTHSWQRKNVVFDIQASDTGGDPLLIGLAPTFEESEENDADEGIVYLSAPQLESGEIVTQYQPTDDIVKYSDDYGAWFSRGGIGGTIQNPLLQLNYDDAGSIGTRTKSFLLRTDGSGYLANENIEWDSNGKVTFGQNVTLNWSNLDQTIKQEMVNKSIKIIGGDTFTMMGDESSAEMEFYPPTINLSIEENNLTSSSSQRQWYYLKDNQWFMIRRANAKTYVVYPDSTMWNDSNVLTLKCVVTIGANTYSDSFTIRKQHIVGYTVEVTSNQGKSFKNGECSTVLRANVYYQGKLVSDDFLKDKFTFVWKKFHLPDITNEVQGWWEEQHDADGNVIQNAIDRTQQEITLGYKITGSDLFVCELQSGSSVFPYTFPIVL